MALIVAAVLLSVSLSSDRNLLAQRGKIHTKPFRDGFKTAPDGVTKGWVVEEPWPDRDDTSQLWRSIGVRVVVVRHGRVVRRIDGGVGVWSWNFWNGGKEVALQRGPVHGATGCDLIDIKSGRTLESWPGDCRLVSEADDVPDWVKTAGGISP